ncbi:tetratricopeptide repeat protein [Daejeonella oryzae]|uniref:tetratricopeptide repeat protein n=1 Tax=Daejeonella oryzae TaxID=1122943 RepID=UPI000413F5DE|nr:tetratricopeptide repeat protein [Daejeonella oryzae]
MKIIFSFFCLLTLTGIASAQSSYQKVGQKALIDGDFKMAVANLEKAIATDSNDVNTLYMLGYSYYHSSNYPKAVSTFNRLISLRPNENSAYYYRGKARNIMAKESKNISNSDREKLLLGSIRDFSKAIQLDENDIKLYQNRALAYRDYGVLKAQKIPGFYDKGKAMQAFKSCIVDFQKVLDINPGRKDISSQLEDARSYLENIK